MDILEINEASTYLKSVACDYIGRLAKYNEALIESLLCVNVIEELSESATSTLAGETEKASAAVSLGVFTAVSVEARRIVTRLNRTVSGLMDGLLKFNKIVHVELVRQWGHFRELKDNKELLLGDN